VDAYLPEGDGPFPTLVLAPGQGYHRALPLLAQLGHRARALGLAVFTFDWAYRSSGGRPSPDLVDEVGDLQAVLTWARQHPGVDTSRLFVGGKSLGSLVAYRAFRADPELAGLMLWTPVCAAGEDDEDEDNYPDIEEEARPVGVFLGDSDPLCPLGELYDWLDDSEGNVAVQVYAGDHSLNLGPWDDPSLARIHASNRAAAHRGALAWWRTTLDRPQR
jgi:dienelactone hydrolase